LLQLPLLHQKWLDAEEWVSDVTQGGEVMTNHLLSGWMHHYLPTSLPPLGCAWSVTIHLVKLPHAHQMVEVVVMEVAIQDR
jgi:hypothetical protein